MTADDTLPLTNREKAHYTNWWCRSIGIRSNDIDSHPQIDDVILLIRWHQECWLDSSKIERGIWSGYWSAVYHKQLPLKAKALKKLEAATQEINSTRISHNVRHGHGTAHSDSSARTSPASTVPLPSRSRRGGAPLPSAGAESP